MKNSKHARHLFTTWVEPSKRDEIIYKLKNSKIGVTVNYRAIHLLSYYKKTFGFKNGVLPIAERIGDSTITLPMYPKMTEAELKYVISVLKKVI